jgi:hypothetical protein
MFWNYRAVGGSGLTGFKDGNDAKKPQVGIDARIPIAQWAIQPFGHECSQERRAWPCALFRRMTGMKKIRLF